MTDTTAISITGIVVSGVIGPTVAAYWSDRRSERERRTALADQDLHELRILFADCLKLLVDARKGLVQTEQAIESGVLSPTTTAEEDEDTLKRMLQARKDLYELQDHIIDMQQEYPRLVLMLGTEHSTVQSFKNATNNLATTLSAPVELVNGLLSQAEALELVKEGSEQHATHMAWFIKACESVARRQPLSA